MKTNHAKRSLAIFLALACGSAYGQAFDAKVPKGWGFHNPSGEYEVKVDSSVQREGKPGVSIRPLVPKPFEPNQGRFGILYQTIRADKYKGKRIRYSAYMSCAKIDVAAYLWLRVDGSIKHRDWYDSSGGNPLSFAIDKGNQCGDGDGDWRRAEVVVDVPKNSGAITFGMSLYGNGAVWANGMSFEAVDDETPLTSDEASLPEAPVNPL
ncbi:MAG: hypothetical protein A3G41_01960 [Elusimicrobia bacterium RIFCSPLOWO2_12_FULL_59_9]|nr:MAG: hypothetical protein A3G41_01960 [Elusimicrobia bacterium RIFCSPLOWO2_12_FULL_59_9]